MDWFSHWLHTRALSESVTNEATQYSFQHISALGLLVGANHAFVHDIREKRHLPCDVLVPLQPSGGNYHVSVHDIREKVIV